MGGATFALMIVGTVMYLTGYFMIEDLPAFFKRRRRPSAIADPHGLTMKLAACVMIAALIGSSSLSAAVEQCRFINSRIDREACYVRQEKALAAKRKPEIVDDANTRSVDDIEMKNENDRLSKSLRSICRGC